MLHWTHSVCCLHVWRQGAGRMKWHDIGIRRQALRSVIVQFSLCRKCIFTRVFYSCGVQTHCLLNGSSIVFHSACATVHLPAPSGWFPRLPGICALLSQKTAACVCSPAASFPPEWSWLASRERIQPPRADSLTWPWARVAQTEAKSIKEIQD